MATGLANVSFNTIGRKPDFPKRLFMNTTHPGMEYGDDERMPLSRPTLLQALSDGSNMDVTSVPSGSHDTTNSSILVASALSKSLVATSEDTLDCPSSPYSLQYPEPIPIETEFQFVSSPKSPARASSPIPVPGSASTLPLLASLRDVHTRLTCSLSTPQPYSTDIDSSAMSNLISRAQSLSQTSLNLAQEALQAAQGSCSAVHNVQMRVEQVLGAAKSREAMIGGFRSQLAELGRCIAVLEQERQSSSADRDVDMSDSTQSTSDEKRLQAERFQNLKEQGVSTRREGEQSIEQHRKERKEVEERLLAEERDKQEREHERLRLIQEKEEEERERLRREQEEQERRHKLAEEQRLRKEKEEHERIRQERKLRAEEQEKRRKAAEEERRRHAAAAEEQREQDVENERRRRAAAASEEQRKQREQNVEERRLRETLKQGKDLDPRRHQAEITHPPIATIAASVFTDSSPTVPPRFPKTRPATMPHHTMNPVARRTLFPMSVEPSKQKNRIASNPDPSPETVRAISLGVRPPNSLSFPNHSLKSRDLPSPTSTVSSTSTTPSIHSYGLNLYTETEIGIPLKLEVKEEYAVGKGVWDKEEVKAAEAVDSAVDGRALTPEPNQKAIEPPSKVIGGSQPSTTPRYVASSDDRRCTPQIPDQTTMQLSASCVPLLAPASTSEVVFDAEVSGSSQSLSSLTLNLTPIQNQKTAQPPPDSCVSQPIPGQSSSSSSVAGSRATVKGDHGPRNVRQIAMSVEHDIAPEPVLLTAEDPIPGSARVNIGVDHYLTLSRPPPPPQTSSPHLPPPPWPLPLPRFRAGTPAVYRESVVPERESSRKKRKRSHEKGHEDEERDVRYDRESGDYGGGGESSHVPPYRGHDERSDHNDDDLSHERDRMRTPPLPPPPQPHASMTLTSRLSGQSDIRPSYANDNSGSSSRQPRQSYPSSPPISYTRSQLSPPPPPQPWFNDGSRPRDHNQHPGQKSRNGPTNMPLSSTSTPPAPKQPYNPNAKPNKVGMARAQLKRKKANGNHRARGGRGRNRGRSVINQQSQGAGSQSFADRIGQWLSSMDL